MRAASGSRALAKAFSGSPGRRRRNVPMSACRLVHQGCLVAGSGHARLVPIPTGHHLRRQQLGADLVLDLAGHFLITLQEGTDVVLALPNAVALVGVPRTGLVDDAVGAGEL